MHVFQSREQLRVSDQGGVGFGFQRVFSDARQAGGHVHGRFGQRVELDLPEARGSLRGSWVVLSGVKGMLVRRITKIIKIIPV